MLKYIIRRIGYLFLVVLAMSIIMFVISHALPGDPARVAAGGERATKVMIEAARERLGLDKPLYIQYFIYIKNLLHGDFGRSFSTNRPILDDLLEMLPASIELTVFALIFACLIGIPLGITAAIHENTWVDNSLKAVSSFFVSMPDFWMGLLLILVFYGKLHLLPFTGRLGFISEPPPLITGFFTIDSLLTGQFQIFGDALLHLILPAITLGFVSIGFFSRMTRSSMVEVLKADYIRTAFGKGLPKKLIYYKHALRNAFIPVLTIIGLQLGNIVGGAVVIETIFAWPGIGRYAVQAVENQDFPAIMGFAIIYSLFYAIVNFAVDIISMFINPRLRNQ
ncbi:MAG: ABC transporter permease [Bacteroidota bacterium]